MAMIVIVHVRYMSPLPPFPWIVYFLSQGKVRTSCKSHPPTIVRNIPLQRLVESLLYKTVSQHVE